MALKTEVDYPDFANSKINNFCIRCSDGELWFCKRILYRKTKLFRELFDSEPEDDEVDVDFCRDIVYLVLQHMEDQRTTIGVDQLPGAYTLCVEWDYRDGTDYLSQHISGLPTVGSVAILYKFHDPRREVATRNLLRSEPSAVHPECSVNPDLMLCVIKSMITIHQSTVCDIVDRLTAKSKSKGLADAAAEIRCQYVRDDKPKIKKK